MGTNNPNTFCVGDEDAVRAGRLVRSGLFDLMKYDFDKPEVEPTLELPVEEPGAQNA